MNRVARKKTVKPKEEKANEGIVKETGNAIPDDILKVLDGVFGQNDGKLFGSLSTAEHEDIEKTELTVAGHRIQVVPRIGRFETYAAISLMLGIMDQEKNRVGYGNFIRMTDDLEFMFFISFFTDIGLHYPLDGYMKIRDLFDREGATKQFYDIIKESREEIKETFKMAYSLWEKEHLAMMAYVPHVMSPSNELAGKVLKIVFGAEESVLSDADEELKNVLAKYALEKSKDLKQQWTTEMKPSKQIMDFNKTMFQKREINDYAPLTVLDSRKK